MMINPRRNIYGVRLARHVTRTGETVNICKTLFMKQWKGSRWKRGCCCKTNLNVSLEVYDCVKWIRLAQDEA